MGGFFRSFCPVPGPKRSSNRNATATALYKFWPLIEKKRKKIRKEKLMYQEI